MNPDDPYNFDNVVERRGTASAKWDKYKEQDIIPMWLADMDFPSPPAVIEALHQRVEQGVFGYPTVPDELITVVLSMLLTEYGWEVQPEWLVWLPGLVTGLNLICRAAAVRGEEVLTAVPVYPPFLTAPGLSRRHLTTLPLIREAGRWTLDFDRLASLITPATRLFLLCNPHNPVGTVFTREELASLAGICDKYNLIICSDEIHCGLVLDPDKVHVPIATLDPAIANRTVTLMSPSKTFNLPGCAFAIIPAEPLRQKFCRAMAGHGPRPQPLQLHRRPGRLPGRGRLAHGAACLPAEEPGEGEPGDSAYARLIHGPRGGDLPGLDRYPGGGDRSTRKIL